jgi:hypothetical protein
MKARMAAASCAEAVAVQQFAAGAHGTRARHAGLPLAGRHAFRAGTVGAPTLQLPGSLRVQKVGISKRFRFSRSGMFYIRLRPKYSHWMWGHGG